MKWIRRQFPFGIALLCAGVILWALAASGWAMASSMWDLGRVSYRAEQTGMAFSDLTELRRQLALSGGGAVTGWAQTLKEPAQLPSVNGSTTIDVVWVDGDAARVMNPKMLRGQMPAQSDRIGCALDEVTAMKLFGSLDIIGREIKISGKDMTVRGVYVLPNLAQPGRALAFCPAALAPDSLEMAALEFSIWPKSGKRATDVAQGAMAAASMGADGDFEDYRDTRSGMAYLTALPGGLLALLMLMRLIAHLSSLSRDAFSRVNALRQQHLSTSRQLGREILSVCAGAGALLALAALIVWQVPLQGAIPPRYLPTRWSDFSFWPKLVQSLLEHSAQARLRAALRPDMLFEATRGVWGMLCALSMVLILWSARALGRAEAGLPAHMIGALPVALAAPMALLLAAYWGLAPGALRGMVVLPVGFYGAIALRCLVDPRWGSPRMESKADFLKIRGFSGRKSGG